MTDLLADAVAAFVDAFAHDRPDWHLRAACRDADPWIFFTDARRFNRRGGGTPPEVNPVMAYCARCPVFNECEDQGQYESAGWWAGTLRHRDNRTTKASAA